MAGRLAVVIVNYRTADLVVGCLRSLRGEGETVPGLRAVVVDNDSADGSAERIAAAIQGAGWGWATTIPLDHNGGFAAGNNAGIRSLLARGDPPEWFLLLNPDTIVRPGALRALLDRGEGRAEIGIVGSRLEDADGTPQASAFRFPSVWSELDRGLRLGVVSRLLARRVVPLAPTEAAGRVDWVSGGCMLIRRRAIADVGLLDEGYFLYYEEVDYCRRAARAGWECWHEPRSRVVHLVGKSTGVDPTGTARRPPRYVLDSRRRFFLKHHGALYAALADLAWLAGHLVWRLRMRIQRRPERAAPGLLGDFVRHSVLVRGWAP